MVEAYVLGHSDHELERLERQGELFREQTRDGLVRAGLREGMRVVDLGCGTGDVSLVAARIVGSSEGSVTGVDLAAEALETARRRSEGQPNVTYVQSALETFDGYGACDAVIGRFIMMHLQDPAKVLREITLRTKPGTLLCFLEMDLDATFQQPPLPLASKMNALVCDVYKRMGRGANSGTLLYEQFRSAGLAPKMFASQRVEEAIEPTGIGFMSEAIRSLLPAIVKLGLATAEEVGIDTLAKRIGEEAARDNPVVFYPRFCVAWARTNAAST